MKKSLIILLAGIICTVSCNKEESKLAGTGTGNGPLLVSVTNSGGSVKVTASDFTSGDSIPVQYILPSDTTIWWVRNLPTGSHDTIIYPGDTSFIPPYIPTARDSTSYTWDSVSTSPAIPPAGNPSPSPSYGDSTGYRGDTTEIYPPAPPYNLPTTIVFPVDSTINHADTLKGNSAVFNPASSSKASGYGFTIQGSRLTIKINVSGIYKILAGTYRRNKDGSFTLTGTGYINFSAK